MSATSKFHVTEAGSGTTPLIFVHGYGCDQNMWRFVAPSFADSHKTLCYDLTGMGGSDIKAYDLDRYAKLEAHADDLGAILSELDLNDAVIIGHSVGATIACLAALRYGDRIKALGLIAPSPSFINDGDYIGGFDRKDVEQLLDMMEQNFFDWTQYVTPLIAGQDPAGETSGELAQSFCRNDPTISKHFARVTFLADHREDIARVNHPALHGGWCLDGAPYERWRSARNRGDGPLPTHDGTGENDRRDQGISWPTQLTSADRAATPI